MSQLFASPEEPQAEGTSTTPVAVKVDGSLLHDDASAPDSASSPDSPVSHDSAVLHDSAVSHDSAAAETKAVQAVPVADGSTPSPYAPPAHASAAYAPAPAATNGRTPDAIFGTPMLEQGGPVNYSVPPVQGGLPRPPRGRNGAFAGIAALALLLGTAGGVGGAAAYEAWGPDQPSTATLPIAAGTPASHAEAGSVAAVAQAVLPSVVQIEATNGGAGTATGSGVIIRADGYILTNNHVIESSDGVVSVLFSDGHVEDGKVVGKSVEYDLAVVHVERTDLTPLVLGDSDAMLVGDPVIAIGSPLGLDSTVTTGIVSAVDRPVTTGDSAQGSAFIAAIQTDAAINPGNSGGPLLNSAGEVIGINSAIAALPGATQATGAGSVGLGFAIPSNQARRVSEELIANGKAEVPVIGALLDIGYKGRGVRVSDSSQLEAGQSGVVAGSPADKAGIKEGDIIVAIDGNPVADADTAVVRIRSHAPGDQVTFTVERDGKDTDVTLTLSSLSSVDYKDDTVASDAPQ